MVSFVRIREAEERAKEAVGRIEAAEVSAANAQRAVEEHSEKYEKAHKQVIELYVIDHLMSWLFVCLVIIYAGGTRFRSEGSPHAEATR